MFSRLYKDMNLTQLHQLNLLATNLEQRLKQNAEQGTVIWELDRIVTAVNRVKFTQQPITFQIASYHPD